MILKKINLLNKKITKKIFTNESIIISGTPRFLTCMLFFLFIKLKLVPYSFKSLVFMLFGVIVFNCLDSYLKIKGMIQNIN